MSNDSHTVAEQSTTYQSGGLPISFDLPVEHLSAVFQSVTNSYKFYWFLAILHEIRDGSGRTISIHKLLSRMLCFAWYPINYFRLSFGKQDQLGHLIARLQDISDLSIASDDSTIMNVCSEVLDGQKYKDKTITKSVSSLSRYVPYRFLRPWFRQPLRGIPDSSVNKTIVDLAEQSFAHHENIKPLYRFDLQADAIEFHPDWFLYLQSHTRILMDFCLWNLVTYIQGRNPNTPGIPNKLFAPNKRKLSRAKRFWDLVIKQSSQPVHCIYSETPVDHTSYSIDHFLPWSFVVHDLSWNLVPTLRAVNSSKSDKLPCLERYLDRFCQQQYQAVHIVGEYGSKEQLEDYLILFQESSYDSLLAMDYSVFSVGLENTISPQLQIANNMGFERRWTFS